MSLIRQILGHRCILCLQQTAIYICQDCSNGLPLIEHACFTCGLPLKDSARYCGDCIKQPKPYTLTISPLLYSHPVDYLIRQFKERSPRHIAKVLAPFLTPHIGQYYSNVSLPNALIPVPLHWHSKLKRGFNQAHCLAEILSSLSGVPCKPLATKRKHQKNQKSLDRAQRLSNLRHSFEVDTDLSGQHVVIVDDIITSCSTAINMANTLFDAGAARVDVWALARTPKTGKTANQHQPSTMRSSDQMANQK